MGRLSGIYASNRAIHGLFYGMHHRPRINVSGLLAKIPRISPTCVERDGILRYDELSFEARPKNVAGKWSAIGGEHTSIEIWGHFNKGHIPREYARSEERRVGKECRN